MPQTADGYYVEEPLPLLGEKHVPDSGGNLKRNAQDENGENGALGLYVAKMTTDTTAPQSENGRTKPGAAIASPHNLMLLYDLFFAANLTAFSNIHETTNGERLVAYVGYFLVLWLLWLNVMLFDVRFVVDSVVERILRAIHLGAMVGISVVAPQYNPADQIRGTFQALSIVLMVSRLVLVVQYGLAILRQPRESRVGLAIMSASHFAAAMVYLGITFRFTDSKNSRVFVAWYIMGFVETVVVFVASFHFRGLSFHRSVLPERTKTATLLILGEGVIVVAEHISTVVKNANSWNVETVGVLTATAALIYVMFQIYFDWSWPAAHFMSSEPFLYLWSLLHLPFHICLVLVMEGATQFVVWWKIVEMINFVSFEFHEAYQAAIASLDIISGSTTVALDMVNRLNSTIESIWRHYPPDLLVTHLHKEALLKEMLAIDNSHWDSFPSLAELEGSTTVTNQKFQDFVDKFRALKVTVLNSILQSFNIEEISDSAWQDHPSTYQQHAYEDASKRFSLVYIYVFCLSGAALIIMSLLHVLSRIETRSTPMQKLTIGVNIMLGVGLMLLASMSRLEAHTRFAMTPWIVPSLCLVYLIALLLVHAARWIERVDGTGKPMPPVQTGSVSNVKTGSESAKSLHPSAAITIAEMQEQAAVQR